MRRHSTYERVAQSLLALLVGAILLRGWLAYTHDGMHLAAEVQIDSPPDRVWAFLVEPKTRTNWQAGVTGVLPLSDGPLSAGARSLILYRDGGPTLELEETVVQTTPPGLWRVLWESDAFRSEIQVTLSATGQASLVAYREKKYLRRYSDRFMAPWLRWRGQRRLDYSMERLKLLSERQSKTAGRANRQ